MVASIYEDDAKVGALTRAAFERTGSRLLQIHRFSVDDEEHAHELLKIFKPRANACIADVGCGVGRLAELMSHERPDIDFTLVNKSAEQLKMCPEGFKTVLGTAEDLPLKRYSVDNIMICYVLGHVDLPKFVSECNRVLDWHGRVFIYDLFTYWKAGCRLESDLQYTARTSNDVMQAFEDGGFRYSRGSFAHHIPVDVFRLMPRHDTLKNTVSAAMVFER